jgi:FKBP-type peptidyl-prolyl cis-trans isomerase FklB
VLLRPAPLRVSARVKPIPIIHERHSMKLQWTSAMILTLVVSPAFAQDEDAKKKPVKPADESAPKTVIEKVSYGIGLNIGKNFKKDGIEVDLELLVKGVKDALAGSKPLLSDAEIREAMTAIQKELQAKQADRAKNAGEKNKKEGEDFLAENKKKEGVKTTKSGLQYKVIKAGTGKTPKAADTVVTHYRGTLIDGTAFDSSYDRGEPATFPVGKVIKGWTEALQLMTVGSKWQLFIPSALAYGEDGAGDDIGPNSVLIFEIELVAIK